MASKTRAIAITTAAAIGVGLGGFGVAAATSAPSQPDADPTAVVEEVDGVDHQFEGEEIGENGDGIAGHDEATEADEAESED